VGRIGGDEFVVVCTQVDSEAAAAQLAAVLQRRLWAPADVDGRHIELSASVGVAWTDDPTIDVDALVEAADSAMDAAKRAKASSAPSV
jgi:diguanylate cyclase (GGDEF)-like protein